MTSIQQFDREVRQSLENRDTRGIERLYQQYGPALYGVICRQVNSVAEAQEILNDAFLMLWKYANFLDLEGSPLFSQLYLLVQEQIKLSTGKSALPSDLGQEVLDLVILGKCHPAELQSILPLSPREIENNLHRGLRRLHDQLSVKK